MAGAAARARRAAAARLLVAVAAMLTLRMLAVVIGEAWLKEEWQLVGESALARKALSQLAQMSQ